MLCSWCRRALHARLMASPSFPRASLLHVLFFLLVAFFSSPLMVLAVDDLTPSYLILGRLAVLPPPPSFHPSVDACSSAHVVLYIVLERFRRIFLAP